MSERNYLTLLTTTWIWCKPLTKSLTLTTTSTLRPDANNSSPIISTTIFSPKCVVVWTGRILDFEVNQDGTTIRIAEAGPPIVVLDTLKQILFYTSHYSKLSGQTRCRKLYYRQLRNYYRAAMEEECYATVRNFPQCTINRIKLRKTVEQLQLLPAIAPLESISIDILGESIKTRQINF